VITLLGVSLGLTSIDNACALRNDASKSRISTEADELVNELPFSALLRDQKSQRKYEASDVIVVD
jgi:hypothetical protein